MPSVWPPSTPCVTPTTSGCFRSWPTRGLAKHHTRWLLIIGHEEPTHGIVVTPDAVAAAVESLESHAAYLAELPWHPVPAKFIPEALAEGGRAVDAEAAFLVRGYDLGQG